MEKSIETNSNKNLDGEAEGRRLTIHDPTWPGGWGDGRNPPSVSAKIREIVGPGDWGPQSVTKGKAGPVKPSNTIHLNTLFDALERISGIHLHKWKRLFLLTGRHVRTFGSVWVVDVVPKRGLLIKDGVPTSLRGIVVPEAITGVNAAALFAALVLNQQYVISETKIETQIAVKIRKRDRSDRSANNGGMSILRKWVRNTWKNPILGPVEELEVLAHMMQDVSGTESIVWSLGALSDGQLREALFTVIHEYAGWMEEAVE